MVGRVTGIASQTLLYEVVRGYYVVTPSVIAKETPQLGVGWNWHVT